MDFEWDPAKASSNIDKHGVTFEEAVSVFGDVFASTINNVLNSATEERFITLGLSHRRRLIVIVHTDRGESVRLISARLASPTERRQYDRR